MLCRLTPDAPYGNLAWGAQSYYSTLFGRIYILSPTTSAIQPILFGQDNQIAVRIPCVSYIPDHSIILLWGKQGYSASWNFTANKQLQLDNVKDHFYAKELHTTMYNYDTVFWLFGSPSQSGIDAAKVTVWRYDP